jgi:hypothetical protein
VPQGSYLVRTAHTAADFASEATAALTVGDTGTLAEPALALDFDSERVSVGAVAGASGYECRLGATGAWAAVALTGGDGAPAGVAGYIALADIGLPAASSGADATLYVRAADSTNAQHPSAGAASVAVPKRRAAPTGLGVMGSTTATGEGKLTGVTSGMEYKGTGATTAPATWTSMDAISTGNFSAAPGSYVVREASTSSAFASAQSAALTILSNAGAPAISTQPQGYTGLTNDGCTLSVTAVSPDGGALSYAWYRNTASESQSGAERIDGATGGYAGYDGATLTVATGAVGDIWYYCVVTNTVASASGATTAATTSSIVRVGLAPESFQIDLSCAQAFDYADQYGYAASSLPVHVMTISNLGNRPTGELTLALSGADAASFVLSSSSVDSVPTTVGDNAASFTVKPAMGLSAGTYTATLTVSGGHGISASETLSFLVRQADVSYVAPVGTNIPYEQAPPGVPHLGLSQIISPVSYMSAGVQTAVPGTWSWDVSASELAAGIAQAGSYAANAVFTPDDTQNFPLIHVSDVPYTCYSPDAVITVVPTANTIDRFQALGSSALIGGEVTSGGLDVTGLGSFYWHVPDPASFAMTHAGAVSMTVAWIPDAANLAIEDPAGSGLYAIHSGYLPAYATVTIVVKQTVNKGVLAAAIDGVDHATGTYAGSTAAAGDATLAAWQGFADNYPQASFCDFMVAYQNATAVYLDEDALQDAVDAAADSLADSLAALAHEHPALDEQDGILGANGSPTVAIDKFDAALNLRFKGAFGTVSGVKLGAEELTLVAGENGIPEFWLNDADGALAGVLTHGSARVVLNAAYMDRLANGSYVLELGFTDAFATGSGTATVVIARSATDPGEGEQPGGVQPGGEEPGGEQPGGEEPGGEEPGDKEPGDKEPEVPGIKDPDDEKPLDKQPGDEQGGFGKAPAGAGGATPDTGDAKTLLLAQLLVCLIGAGAICLRTASKLRLKARRNKAL